MEQKVGQKRQRISTLGQIGLQQFAPYLMNRIMGRYNANLREELRRPPVEGDSALLGAAELSVRSLEGARITRVGIKLG